MSGILILEDEVVIRDALRKLLQRHGHRVDQAGSVDEATELFDLTSFDLIIADLRLPGAPGTAVIDLCDGVPVLVMTSYASVKSAVDSMKRGAADYIAKPFDHEEMTLVVERLLRQTRLERQNAALKLDLHRNYPVSGMIGSCAAMREAFDRIKRVAPTSTTVLILGESGTGKELVARAVHEHSTRRDAPLVAVNCASIPDTLIESELFGHEKGAFTGAVSTRTGLVEAADGGSLFLDEIAELSDAAQARLLRVLQDGEIRKVGSNENRRVDVRVLAATHRDLEQRVNDGSFRSDLLFRLKVMEIHLPPLRERGADIQQLAEYLLKKVCKNLNRPELGFSNEALAAITAHTWAGNVRELENAIERAVILCDENTIDAALLHSNVQHAATPFVDTPGEDGASLEQYFRRFVLAHQANLTETELARRLGISRKTLWEKRQRLGLQRNRRTG
ncbi:MAG: sigma-54 dependent transcriptional regulator [Gammaproteobacteria bacterium]|nr:sigma-54 dependent transcriptional regulator [Gammaproteobacteria bacterium]